MEAKAMAHMTWEGSVGFACEPSRCPACKARKTTLRWWREARGGRRYRRTSPGKGYFECRDHWHFGTLVIKGITT